MIADGEVFTAEISCEDIWITSTPPPVDWTQTYS